jgi:exopolyphosphatase/guanosine-5'-triphosphate,3'-diphosphate pyrophosphatase
MPDGEDVREAAEGLDRVRLIYAAVRPALADRGARAVLFDVGQWSTRAILGDAHQVLLASALGLGVRRLQHHWLRADPSSPGDVAVTGEWVRTVIGSTVARFQAAGFDAVCVIAAGALPQLAGRRLPRTGAIDRCEVELAHVAGWEARLAAMPAAQRALLPGLDPDQADTLLPAAVILRALMEAAKVERLVVCEAIPRESAVSRTSFRRDPMPVRPAMESGPSVASSST